MIKVYRIGLNELSEACTKLKKYIDQEKPDWIIPICSGGLELCELLWDKSEMPENIIHGVYIQHQTSSFLKSSIKFLPVFITDFLRKIGYILPKSKKRKILIGNDLGKLQGKVLILDDAIDSGYTLDILMSRLGRVDTRTAILNNISGFCTLDFTLYNNMIVKFPWNCDYK